MGIWEKGVGGIPFEHYGSVAFFGFNLNNGKVVGYFGSDNESHFPQQIILLNILNLCFTILTKQI